MRVAGLYAADEELTANVASAGRSSGVINTAGQSRISVAALNSMRIDANLADLALADASERSDRNVNDGFPTGNVTPKTPLYSEHAWTELASDWNPWPAFALA